MSRRLKIFLTVLETQQIPVTATRKNACLDRKRHTDGDKFRLRLILVIESGVWAGGSIYLAKSPTTEDEETLKRGRTQPFLTGFTFRREH